MSIKVIGAGYPRTGTMSLKYALEELGLGKSYHMIDFVKDTSSINFWEKKFKRGSGDWDELLNNCQSIVDFPGSLFVEDLMEQYPDAKVILTTRNVEGWYESMKSTVIATQKKKDEKNLSDLEKEQDKNIKLMRKLIWEERFEGRQNDKNYMIKKFEDHYAHVKKIVPAKNLLIYNIGDGWDELVEFLQLEKPRTTFPEVNKRTSFHEMLSEAKKQSLKKVDY